jgi:hypothetical protein
MLVIHNFRLSFYPEQVVTLATGMAIISDYIEGACPLSDYVALKAPLSEDDARSIFAGIVSALSFCHAQAHITYPQPFAHG